MTFEITYKHIFSGKKRTCRIAAGDEDEARFYWHQKGLSCDWFIVKTRRVK